MQTSTLPILALSGQLGRSAPWARSIWADEQALLPLAAAGFTAIPSGKLTVVSLMLEVARSASPSLWGTLSSTSTPVGLSAAVVSGCRVRLGSNFSAEQPFRPTGLPAVSVLGASLAWGTPGSSQLFAVAVVTRGSLEQGLAIVRNGLPVCSGSGTGQEPPKERHSPRISSWLAAEGSPQSCA